jgi:hypothetical protein
VAEGGQVHVPVQHLGDGLHVPGGLADHLRQKVFVVAGFPLRLGQVADPASEDPNVQGVRRGLAGVLRRSLTVAFRI